VRRVGRLVALLLLLLPLVVRRVAGQLRVLVVLGPRWVLGFPSRPLLARYGRQLPEISGWAT
jgi:hypothetical protein